MIPARMPRIGATDEFYDSALYDLNVEGGPRVEALYERRLSGLAGTVVEFGCGTGTLLLALAQQGWSGLGIDRSGAMLEAFRTKLDTLPQGACRPDLQLSDMREAPARPVFDVAICANDICTHLLDRDALVVGLANVADHLRPGGLLLTDQPRFDPVALASAAGLGGGPLRHRGSRLIAERKRLQVWEQTRYDPDTGRLMVHFRYELLGPRGDVVQSDHRTLEMHPWRIDEIVLALKTVGFRTVTVRDVSAETGHARDLVEATDRRT